MGKLSKKVSGKHAGTFILPSGTRKKFPYFAICIANILQEKFPKTFVVGGAVRNLLLNKKIIDVDLATSATPVEVIKLLKANKIPYSDQHKSLGIIIAFGSGKNSKQKLEIATFRKEVYGKSRFPKVSFIKNPRLDSQRRDFTINALYYSVADNSILDFHGGIADLQKKQIKFIGKPLTRIKEDPLRIVRAYRFQIQYKLNLEKQTAKVLDENKIIVKKISNSRVKREINALTSMQQQKKLQKVIHNAS